MEQNLLDPLEQLWQIGEQSRCDTVFRVIMFHPCKENEGYADCEMVAVFDKTHHVTGSGANPTEAFDSLMAKLKERNLAGQ